MAIKGRTQRTGWAVGRKIGIPLAGMAVTALAVIGLVVGNGDPAPTSVGTAGQTAAWDDAAVIDEATAFQRWGPRTGTGAPNAAPGAGTAGRESFPQAVPGDETWGGGAPSSVVPGPVEDDLIAEIEVLKRLLYGTGGDGSADAYAEAIAEHDRLVAEALALEAWGGTSAGTGGDDLVDEAEAFKRQLYRGTFAGEDR